MFAKKYSLDKVRRYLRNLSYPSLNEKKIHRKGLKSYKIITKVLILLYGIILNSA